MSRNHLLCCLIFLCSWGPLQAQHLNFRNYLADQVSNGTVYHSLQDSRGFLWFATESGVIRFDGRDYHQFTMDDGLSDNEVLKVYEDSQQRIWFLTLSGRLCYFRDNKFYNSTNDPVLKKVSSFSGSTLVSFFEDSRHNLWFAGLHNKYIKISANRKVSCYSFANVSQGRESFFFEDGEKKLLLACRDGFYELHGGQPVRRLLPYRPKISRSFYFRGKGEVIFLAEEGLIYMQGRHQKILIPADKIPPTQGLSYLYLDQNQDLWVTSVTDGVFCYKKVFRNRGQYEHYLPGKIITWVNQDSEKNLWFSSIGQGVFMSPSNQLQGKTFTKEQGLAENQINAVTVDPAGQIWLGLYGGLVNMIGPRGIRQFETHWTKTKLPNNRVRQILADSAGNIWLGTDLGLSLLKKGKQASYQKSHYLRPDSSAYSVKSFILTPASRDIYIAQSSGIEKAAVRQAGSPLILPVPGLPRVRTFTNFFDHAGNLWFSNVNGLNKYDGQQVITYGEQSHPLFASRITDITETPQHQLVLATYGNGLLFFKDGRILKQVTKKDGLPENICKKLFIQDDVLWVATNKGLGKLLLSEKKFFSRPVSYTVSDGLVSNEVNDVFADGKNVYIATAKGLNIIPNRPLVQQTSPPVIQFTGVYTDNRAIDLRQAAELAPEQNRLLFKFIAITFQDPANVMYQYRLHQENYWVNTQNNSVELSALGPGRHTFQVRAKKLNSAWGAPITYQFYIQPPFWRSWWFLGLLAFGGLLTVVVSVRLYIVIKLRQQMRRLETEYRVQQERERIARDLHDNVGSHLAYIINSLEETPGQAGTTVAANAQDLREYTKQTIAQLRETIWAIRQEAISVRELGAKIQKLIWQISSHRPDFEYEVVIQGNQEAELTPAQALNLFRIAQEAVNNVFKHSHSTCVWVTLTVKQQAHLEMRIEDRGQGFERDSQGPEDHYGLVNMQERAKELGAYFKIYSVPAQGTQVYIKVGLE